MKKIKKIKNIVVVLLLVVLTVGMCGCDKKSAVKPTPEPKPVEEPVVDPNTVPEPDTEPDTEPEPQNGPSTGNYSEDDITEKVKIVVNNREITPEDNNGNKVETIIHNGVVYLPVKTVADITGLAYYWDGPNYTAYLGAMDGTLEYPTVEIEKMTSINESVQSTDSLKDNYGNTYSRAIYNDYDNYKFEYLLEMKYSRFKGILYIPEGENDNESRYLKIIADGTTIYTSPEMTKSSAPVVVDVNVTGYNDVKIEFNDHNNDSVDVTLCLAEAGFYQ